MKMRPHVRAAESSKHVRVGCRWKALGTDHRAALFRQPAPGTGQNRVQRCSQAAVGRPREDVWQTRDTTVNSSVSRQQISWLKNKCCEMNTHVSATFQTTVGHVSWVFVWGNPPKSMIIDSSSVFACKSFSRSESAGDGVWL